MRCAFALAVLGLLLPLLPAQSAGDQNVDNYQKRRDEEYFEAGQRHLRLGSWARKQTGLVPQATHQFVRAVEVSENKNPGAVTVLSIMRSYGEAFWRNPRQKPSKATLAQYDKKAAAAERDNQQGQQKLAKLADKAKLSGRSSEHWLAALRLGAELEITDKGAKIGGEKVPAELIDWLQGQTQTVNGTERAFEPAGENAPKFANVREAVSDELLVRTDLPAEQAKELHELGLALRAPLRERLDGAPVKRLRLFVFGKRVDYDAYLEVLGHKNTAGIGLCDYGTYQTLVCAEGLATDDLHAIVLHELSHLYFFGTSPVAMPDWYAEGFAETFGGQGTFVWDGKTLSTGGPMRKDRVEAVQQNPMPLRELLAADAMQLLAADRDRGMIFYAQCQLLQRFLMEPDCPWGKRFEWWEDECRGALPGAVSTIRPGDPGPAKAAFDRLFGEDLDKLEQAFLVWVRSQDQ